MDIREGAQCKAAAASVPRVELRGSSRAGEQCRGVRRQGLLGSLSQRFPGALVHQPSRRHRAAGPAGSARLPSSEGAGQPRLSAASRSETARVIHLQLTSCRTRFCCLEEVENFYGFHIRFP